MSNKTIYVGIDDGHNTTCVVASDGKKIIARVCIPSRAINGEKRKLSALGKSDDKTSVYQCGDEVFTLGDITDTLPTNINEYPVSALNRAIVHYALHVAGLDFSKSEADLIITTGLPLKHYYRSGKMNKELIKNKRLNLLTSAKGHEIFSKDGYNIPNIVKHNVFAEALAAYINFAKDLNENTGELVSNEDFLNKNIAIIDIGGRTTDIAVVKNYIISFDKCETIDIGMLDVHDVIRERIIEEFEIMPSNEAVDRAVNEQKIKVFGKDEDVSYIVNSAKSEVIGKINNYVKKKLGNGAEFDEVIFIGGGSEVFSDRLSEWFPRNTRPAVDSSPLFANAEGLMKCSIQVGLKG